MSEKKARHLLVEFGCEELPSRWAGFLGRWLQTMIPRHPAMVHALEELVCNDNRGISFGVDFIAGPRRFGALLRYHDWQPKSQGGIVHGPRLSAPEHAKLGFALKHGVLLSELERRDGKYCLITPPPDLKEAFATAVRDLVADTTNGKPWKVIIDDYQKDSGEESFLGLEDIQNLHIHIAQMGSSVKVEANRWPESERGFARPVRWIVCMVDDEIVPLQMFGCTSGNVTYGHQSTRNKSKPLGHEIALKDAAGYHKTLEGAQVLASYLKQQLKVFHLNTPDAMCTADNPEWLEDTIHDARFARLPSSLVASTLYAHLKAHAKKPTEGSTKVHYSVLSDLPPGASDETIEHIKKGYRRVVNARLNDAAFMLEQDIPSNDNLSDIEERFRERLKNTTYVEGLGSQSDRITGVVQIVSKLAAQLAEAGVIEPSHWKELQGDIELAAKWSLLDLGSQSVREAPSTHRIIAASALEGDTSSDSARSHRVAAMLRKIHNPYGFLGYSYNADPFGTSTPDCSGGIAWNKEALPSDTVKRAEFLLTVADSLYLVAGMAVLDRLPTGSSDLLAVRRSARDICGYFVTHRLSSPSLEALFDLAVKATPLTPKQGNDLEAKSRFCDFLENLLLSEETDVLDPQNGLKELCGAAKKSQDAQFTKLLEFSTHHSLASFRLRELFSHYNVDRKPLDLTGHQWLAEPNQQARARRITINSWRYALQQACENSWGRNQHGGLQYTSPLRSEEALPAIEQRLNTKVIGLQKSLGITARGEINPSRTWLDLVGNTAKRAAGLVDNTGASSNLGYKLKDADEQRLDQVLNDAEDLISDIRAERDTPRVSLRLENLTWAENPSDNRVLPEELQYLKKQNSHLFAQIAEQNVDKDGKDLRVYDIDNFHKTLVNLGRDWIQTDKENSLLKSDFKRLKLLVSIDGMLKRCSKLLDADPASEDAAMLQDLYDELRSYTMQMSEVDALVLRFHVVGVVCMAAQEFFEFNKVHHDVPAVRERRLALTRRLHAFIGKYLGTYA